MGRGEYRRRNAKISTGDLLCVRMSDFKKEKCRIGEGSIRFMYDIKDKEGKPFTVNKSIPLVLTPCNFGGHRKWFLCGCGRRVFTMFIHGQEIACRHCFNAVYPSQGEDAIGRLWRKIWKLEAILNIHGDDPVFMIGDRYRPKGMHWTTFYRIKHEWMKAHIEKDELIESVWSCRFPKMVF